MDERKSLSQSGLFIMVIIVIVLMVAVMLSIAKKVRELSPAHDEATPIVTVALNMPSPLTVTVRVISTQCLDREKIDYSMVELGVSGGHSPYELTIVNSELEQSGPYLILTDNLPIRIKVYGSDYFTATIRSDAGEIWSGNIGLPAEAEICEVSSTSTFESIATSIEPLTTQTVQFHIPSTSSFAATSTIQPTVTSTNAPSPTSTIQPTITSTITPTAIPKTVWDRVVETQPLLAAIISTCGLILATIITGYLTIKSKRSESEASSKSATDSVVSSPESKKIKK